MRYQLCLIKRKNILCIDGITRVCEYGCLEREASVYTLPVARDDKKDRKNSDAFHHLIAGKCIQYSTFKFQNGAAK